MHLYDIHKVPGSILSAQKWVVTDINVPFLNIRLNSDFFWGGGVNKSTLISGSD